VVNRVHAAEPPAERQIVEVGLDEREPAVGEQGVEVAAFDPERIINP
jgi:hypothetical protein